MVMGDKGEQEEIAEGNEEYQSEHGTPLVPDTPGLDVRMQWPADGPSEAGIASRCYQSEQYCGQAFVPRIHVEPKRLEQVEHRPDDDTIQDAVSQQMTALLKRICASKE